MRPDYSYDYVATVIDGHQDHYQGRRGLCSIRYDNRVLYYRIARGHRREFRDWIKNCYEQETNCAFRITGRYPCYYADSLG